MSAAAHPAERRAHVRIERRGAVRLITAAGAHRASLIDVSRGGAQIRTERAPGEWGDSVELRSESDDTVGGVRCTIVRVQNDSDGVRLGLRFEVLEPGTEQWLLGQPA